MASNERKPRWWPKKQELENDIKRWDDKAYVTAQARERLGFVFPGETAVHVLHPEAVTGSEDSKSDSSSSSESNKKVLPWYSELAYSFKKADEPVSQSKDDSSGGSDSGNTQDEQNNTQDSNQTNTGEGTQQ